MTPLHQKIIEFVPEIKELKFGCRFSFIDGSRSCVVLDITHKHLDFMVYLPGIGWKIDRLARKDVDGYMKILGRPITLADVLRAIHLTAPANKTLVTLESDGQFIIKRYDDNGKTVEGGPRWNLSTDLDGQSEECKAFLSKVLGV